MPADDQPGPGDVLGIERFRGCQEMEPTLFASLGRRFG
jgi:hypothetical protein